MITEGFQRLTLISIALAIVLLTTPSVARATDTSALQNPLSTPYAAPEIADITGWINAEAPLTLAGLKGKVVLVDFWTYSCINCIRTFPYIQKWYTTYKDEGFVVIGVHTPEFVFETKRNNIERAAKKYKLTYPIAIDNNRSTWQAFANRYWPAHYLIDRAGNVVYTHFGEGSYDVTEHNIRTLLELEKTSGLDAGTNVTSQAQTPETYLGKARAAREWKAYINKIPLHHWQTSGDWLQEKEYIQSIRAGSTLTLHFSAKKVFLVLESADENPVEAQIKIGEAGNKTMFGKDAPNGIVNVTEARLYALVDMPSHGENILHITSTTPGLRAYAITFESDGK